MESLGGDDGRRRRAQAILGASDGTMQFTTLQSPQKQEQQQQRQHEEELPQAAAAETKSAPVDNNQEDDEEEAITTFWNLHDEVERLKEAQDIQVRDGVQTNVEDQDDGDGEAEEQYDIHYGENTGSSLGIFILPSDEDHSSSVSVDELRGDEEKTPSSPYHIFHGKQSEENTATGNYGSYGGGGSSSPPKGSGGSSGSYGGAGSSSNNSGGISPEESQLRDVLTNVKELGSNVNIAIHQKTSSEKNGVNDPLRAPSNFDFYNPGGGGPLPGTGTSNGGETIAPPRGNDGPTSQPTFFGKRNCKATNGSFGDNRQERSGGGVTLKFRYELNTDATPGGPYQRASLYNEILPALEDSMTTMMLPAFFSDECMKISGSVSRRKVIRGRFLRGGGGGNEDQVQLFEGLDLLEEDPTTLGYQHQHRRLNRVIGIDSDPMDFPLNGERCFGGYSPPNPTIVPKCYVMEGSMTVYFPENFDFKNLVTGAQLTALNTIKEGMEFGTIAEMAHPAILDLTFLESSYSLRPIIPGENVPQAVAPETKDAAAGGGGNVGLIVGIICVLVVFVIIAGCFFRYRLKQEQAKLDAMMRNNTSKKEKKKKKKKKKGSDIDDDSDRSSDGTPSDPTSLYILNRYANEMGDADDEDNLTDREKEIHQRLKKRRKVKKKMRRASYASNLSSNHDGSFSTLDTDSDLMGYYANMGASGTTGSKTTTSSDSTTENSGTSGSESSTTSHSQTFHTTSTGTSEQTTSDSGTTSSGGTTSDSDDDSEEEDAFDMNDEHFNVGAAGTNTFSNGAMKGQKRKKKGQKSSLIMTGDDDDGSVGTEATGATEAISNVNSGGNRGGGYGGGFSGGASAATEVMGNAGKTNPYGSSEWGGGGFSGGASAAPSVDFSAATEAMGNVGRGRNNLGGGGGGFSGGASAAVSVDFSAATEAMGNVGRGKKKSGGGFSGGGSAGPGASVAMSAATEAIKNTGRGRKPQQMESIGELTFSDF